MFFVKYLIFWPFFVKLWKSFFVTAPILAKTSRYESSTLMFCHKLSRKTFWRLRSRRMEKTLTCSHHGRKHPIPSHPILASASSSESSTLSRFVTNLAGKPFDDSVPDEWKRHQLAHTAAENIFYSPILARASSSESSTLSRFVTNLAGKPFDNSVPDEWKIHQLAHTAAENKSYTPILAIASSSESSTLSCFVTNMLYTPILARASSAESSKLLSFVTNLTGHYTILARPFRSESSTLTFCHKYSRKTYWRLCSRCTEKTPTGSHRALTYIIA